MLEVPYLDFVETHLKILEIKAFDTDVLLLIVPNSAHTMHTPITLGTFHIDMVIKLATKKELESLNKQWKRSLIGTKLTTKDVQIVSKIDSIVKIARDTTTVPFGTAKVKGAIKTATHYKHVNIVIDDLPENQSCKDIASYPKIQNLKPGSNKIPVALKNLSCRKE